MGRLFGTDGVRGKAGGPPLDEATVRRLGAGRASWPWNAGGFMQPNYPPFFPMTPGSVQFDYGGRTINAMPGLDEAEGNMIVEWLAKRLPAGASGMGQN